MAAVAIYGMGEDPFGIYRGKYGERHHGRYASHDHTTQQQAQPLLGGSEVGKTDSFL